MLSPLSWTAPKPATATGTAQLADLKPRPSPTLGRHSSVDSCAGSRLKPPPRCDVRMSVTVTLIRTAETELSRFINGIRQQSRTGTGDDGGHRCEHEAPDPQLIQVKGRHGQRVQPVGPGISTRVPMSSAPYLRRRACRVGEQRAFVVVEAHAGGKVPTPTCNVNRCIDSALGRAPGEQGRDRRARGDQGRYSSAIRMIVPSVMVT
jgi:hypothetical protein